LDMGVNRQNVPIIEELVLAIPRKVSASAGDCHAGLLGSRVTQLQILQRKGEAYGFRD
jgi:hypothetical protein